jgi:uncharacterized membrane protein YedE/YeeE
MIRTSSAVHVAAVDAAAGSAVARTDTSTAIRALAAYLVIGTLFGILFTKAEVISWFRIQEMFRFQSIHMYGIIGSAVAVAAASVWLIKRFRARTFSGEPIVIPPKELGGGTRYWVGGTIFGLGWALTGACPGPLFALIGAGNGVVVVVLASAIAGTWLYGWLPSL